MVFNTQWQNFLETQPVNNYLTFYFPNFATAGISKSATWDGTMYFSTDTINWYVWDGSSIYATDHYIYLRGERNTVISPTYSPIQNINNQDLYCSGNIESLLDWRAVGRGLHPVMGEYAFYQLFAFDQGLKSAPSLLAPVLSKKCYSQMFMGCYYLETPPAFSATTLAEACCEFMFYGCGLTSVPELPATTLAPYCYQNMFVECTNLTTVPANLLPATTLAPYCYRSMFLDCINLTTVPALPATTLAEGCYSRMFMGCYNLTTAPALPATTLAEGCYELMFCACMLLEQIPRIPLTAGILNAYASMFFGCRNIQIGYGPGVRYYIGENESLGNTEIFKGCNENSFTTTVEGTAYYTTNTVIG